MRSRIACLTMSLLAAISVWLTAADSPFVPKPGEVLTYRVYIAGLALGVERLSAKAGKTGDGRPALVLEMTLDSNPSVSALVDYHEQRTVLWDQEGAFPLAEAGTITQRRSVSHEKVEFAPDEGAIVVTRTCPDGTVSSASLTCTGNAQTGTSLLHFFRTFPWERGQKMVPLVENGKVAWYAFEVAAEKEQIRVPFGSFAQSYHLYNAQLKYDVWLDRGPGHLPLEIRSKAGFGLVQAKLVSAENYL